MPVSPARQAAFKILNRLEGRRRFAVELLQSEPVERLEARDRNLTQELVLGVTRRRNQLDFLIEKLSRRPVSKLDREVLTALRLGAYQICRLTKVPKSAAVNESVELVKSAKKHSAAGLVNAVLRKITPESLDPLVSELSGSEAESLRLAHPGWLLERWKRNLGPEKAAAWVARNNLPPPVTLRATASAPSRLEISDSLAAEGVETSPCRFSPIGLQVKSGNVTGTAAYREGRVVIQDEASQLVAFLAAPQEGDSVLDLCAAPGMKANHLAELMKSGLLVACDRSFARLQTARRLLQERTFMGEQGRAMEENFLPQPLWVCCDGTETLPFLEKFDLILVDAPCSGTGTIRRNPEIKWRLEEKELMSRYARLQRSLLENAVQYLKPGGKLVYATCSLEPEENEEVVRAALDARSDLTLESRGTMLLEQPDFGPFFDEEGFFRTPMHQAVPEEREAEGEMDGFFAAVVRRQ